jgi:serine/threonine protein kinase
MAALSGRTLVGRYSIQERLGGNGTAEVYRACDRILDREVAVKILIDRSEAINRRFLREAQALRSWNHPCIVSLYDAGEEDGVAFVVMEFVRGKTLRQLEGGSISYRQALTFLIDVLEALDYAHGQAAIHRDIKPSNIMTVENGSHVKVMDFGCARRIGDLAQATCASHVGAIGYLAPERFLNKPADVRSDLYSAGIVMYEIFTGRTPLRSDNGDFIGTAYSHVHDRPKSPRELDANIPDALDRVIMRAIEKEPSRRYQSARGFIDDLHGLLSLPATKNDERRRAQRTGDPIQEPVKSPNDAYDAVLKAMLAARRGAYDEAQRWFSAALQALAAEDNRLEYAKTALKFGTMIVQKCADGLGTPDELRHSIETLHEAAEVFRDCNLAEQVEQTESLIAALERTAIRR